MTRETLRELTVIVAVASAIPVFIYGIRYFTVVRALRLSVSAAIVMFASIWAVIGVLVALRAVG